MIPFRDANPSSRVPIVTIGLILINALFFLQEVGMGEALQSFIYAYGVVPQKWLFAGQSPELAPEAIAATYLTSIFLHGGWMHLIGNMWYLWIFGDNIEDRLGHVRFLAFYILCGLLAGAAHTAFNLNSAMPAVGASGAIAGVLGAYLVLFPHARVQTLVPFFLHYEILELPALIVLGGWFFIQFLNGTASIAMTAQGGGVAWWAHIGGFLAGIFLLSVFHPRRRH